ncbi:Hpt domain-containing protein [Massilia sp. DWR3-1-1]|uniref:hybrid sensor histidine kinase/response regulator n=1 Tax=Massilia sp. DWR3-1-1 TaxID=2804559 RepID=UPI003CEA0C4A
MTDHSSTPPAAATAFFDTGPLSWVIGEIREALARARAALAEAEAHPGDARVTSLQHARAHLHQAHGALQMVDVEGVGLLTAAAESVLERMRDGTLEVSTAGCEAIAEACQAIAEYLDELMAGAAPQPARLFPYHRALQQALGAERIHPSDLLFVDLSAQVPLAPAGAAADSLTADYAAYRARFEKALLPFLKSADGAAQRSNAQALQEAIALVEQAQVEAPARTFWMAMRCFAELVASGQVHGDLYVKQLFGLINLQIRRLSQGQGGLPEAMLRDALFFIAAASAPSADAQSLRRAYGLAGVVPADYDSRRYGRIDPHALKSATDALAQAKTDWDRVAADPGIKLEQQFNQSLAHLAQASEQLGAPALTQLLHELGRAAQDSIAAGRSDQFSMEMATAMLFVEQGLDQVRQLPADFAGRAEVVGARLLALAAGETPPAAPEWQGDLSRQIAQGQTVAALAAEMKTALRQVEKVLDDYYADAARRPALATIDPLLHQLHGALAILDQDQAVQAAQHIRDAVKALAAGAALPAQDAAALQDIARNVGAMGFYIDMLGRDFDAAQRSFRFDAASGRFEQLPFEKQRAGDTPFDVEPAAAAVPAPVPASVSATAPPLADGDAAIEAELLEIFISEAQDVLALVGATVPAARAEPTSQHSLTTLRRAFHTLKGSGRMVGLHNFAEGAAAVEKVMNVWLGDARAATPALLALLEYAHGEMTAWVDELAIDGFSARTSAALVAAAGAVQDGGQFVLDGATAVPEAPGDAATATDTDTATAIDTDTDTAIATDTDTATATDTDTATGAPHDGHDASAPEADDEPHALAGPDTPAPAPVPAPAGAGGRVIEFPSAVPEAPLADNIRRFGDLEIPLPLYNIYLAETDELMRVLTQDFGEWRHEPLRAVTAAALKAAHTLAGTSATVGFKALRDVAYALEMALLTLVEPAPVLNDPQRDLLDEALAAAGQMLRLFAQGELPAARPALVERLVALREALSAQTVTSAPADADAYADVGYDDGDGGDDEPVLAAPGAHGDSEPLSDFATDIRFDPDLEAEAGALDAAPEPEPEPEPAPAAEPAPLAAEARLEPATLAERAPDSVAAPLETAISDDLDADLLPVFLEEAVDLLPTVGALLRQWQANPADPAPAQQLLRILHTVKGSARMAGAMRLGQHTHEIETQIENMVHAGSTTAAAFDEVLANYDHAMLLFEQLHNPAAPVAAPDAGDAGLPAAPPLAGADGGPARTALVRVRADILDRLVNQAGEVSITRSKLENQVATLKTSLADFSDNLARLARQLREVEMQAESQIASRMSISSEREFDPLEFDRFTRLQELTRMMAESVGDVASFHDSLSRTVDAASADLVQQSRLTRDLQRDLMRVRMVPFASLSERLFRVARQSAKELDKRVNLDIRGSAVEIDRSVLEQMAAPFEHLLRNAIVHGIEPRARRGAAGKAETGELLMQVSQQGNEVVIQISDDGAGLDLARIRAKAVQAGLLEAGASITDAEAAELIFAPGLSTADSLSELAGRGVGMDVVRSQAQALGGRVAIETTAGKGARFTVHLPLTLAVTQVVLTASAGTTYALPSILVEQVLQMKEGALVEAHAACVLRFQGQNVALHYLPALLGQAGARPLAQRSSPVLMLKSGADRLAVQVDDVVGNREVVIKNIGPQLARMVGIAGATVLGSGEIVLILNPVALALHGAGRSHAAGQTPAALAPVAPREAVIMVVDDSLTVRKVTQRLLEREGYRVILAKDGVDALDHLQETIPDLMLVDIEMPRMDGFDLTRNIRGNGSTAHVPIIMITSRTADKHRNYALGLGVNAYFGKPFQEAMLLAAIAGLLDPVVTAPSA